MSKCPAVSWAPLELISALLQCLLISGSLSKSGPLDFGTKNNFPSFFVSEKGLAHIYIEKQFIIFQFLIFALLLAHLRKPQGPLAGTTRYFRAKVNFKS